MIYNVRFSPYAKKYLRTRAVDLLTDTVRITRPAPAVLDPITNEYSQPAGETIYEGVGRLWEMAASMSVTMNDENMAVGQTYLSLPWDIDRIPEMEDLVEVLTSDDVDVTGRTAVLGAPARGGNLRGTRRFAAKVESSTKDNW